jgi:hypothetical protein
MKPLLPVTALMRDDFPTFDRPMTAISGRVGLGIWDAMPQMCSRVKGESSLFFPVPFDGPVRDFCFRAAGPVLCFMGMARFVCPPLEAERPK